MNKVFIVGGPTGSGKTDFALGLAARFNGELINADSMQIYEKLKIGVNKGDLSTKNGEKFIKDIPIHLIDFLDLNRRFSVFEWMRESTKIIREIIDRKKTPIIVGGTGLYIDSLLKNYDYEISNNQKLDRSIELNDNLKLKDLQEIFINKLPEIWTQLNNSERNNHRRLIRKLEKITNTHAQMIEQEVTQDDIETHKFVKSNHHFFYPRYDWEDLKKKIDKRVELMFENGLIDETISLLAEGYSSDSPGLNIMGYKEVIRLLNGEIDLEKCKSLVKISHIQYARRQRTWFEGEGRGYSLDIVEF